MISPLASSCCWLFLSSLSTIEVAEALRAVAPLGTLPGLASGTPPAGGATAAVIIAGCDRRAPIRSQPLIGSAIKVKLIPMILPTQLPLCLKSENDFQGFRNLMDSERQLQCEKDFKRLHKFELFPTPHYIKSKDVRVAKLKRLRRMLVGKAYASRV